MKLLAIFACGVVLVWFALFFGVVVEAQDNSPVYVPMLVYNVTPVPTPTATATFTPTPTPTP